MGAAVKKTAALLIKGELCMTDYQLLIIGGGPGGYEAALHAVELGMQVALVERRDIGGTCLNRGCVPTKTLLHSSELYASAEKAPMLGADLSNRRPDMERIFARKAEVSKTLRDGVTALMEGEGITILRGSAMLTKDGHTVRITNESGVQEVTAQSVMIATGSKPACPPIPGLDLEGVLTSDDLLDGSVREFDSIVVIGGGVIGVELATFYCELGCQVTVLEGLSHLLPPLDKELGQNLAAILKKKGVKVVTGAMVSEVVREGDGLRVNYTLRDKAESVSTKVVLSAIGRAPETAGLLDEGLALEMDRRRIRVNDRYETSLPGVYAVGDVSARIQLAHMAAAQGRHCVELLAGVDSGRNMNVVPSCVYCALEIASVGMTLEEAAAAGLDAISAKYVMFANARTLIAEAPRSFMKVVVEKGSHRILGAQLMCERGGDIIGEFTDAVVNGFTVEQMLRSIRPHPSFEEGVQEALLAAQKKLSE